MTFDDSTPMDPEQIQQLQPVPTRKWGREPEPSPCPPTGFYATGPTTPPKERTGLVVMILLILVLLGGIFATLMLLNIRFLGFGSQRATSFARNAPVQASSSGVPALISIQEGGRELSLQQIYAANIDCVASITTDSRSGCAVVLTEDGYLVTSAQIAAGGDIHVLFNDGRELTAQLVGTDSLTGLAVLQVNATDLTPAIFGDSDQAQVGDTVVAIGDPLGVSLRGTFTDGILSAINRNVGVTDGELTLMQTNATLNEGNAGGPLINLYGQVIGINIPKASVLESDDTTGICLVIPSNTVAKVTSQLIAQGYVSGRPVLGFEYGDLGVLTQAYLMVNGICITDVDASSSAYAEGLRIGDIILSVDDQPITSAQDMDSYKERLAPGDICTLTVYRNGLTVTLIITIGGES